ncbi:MAG: CDP-alcohol phosphatidyltransferase family protein [Myxococcota bacterium]
MEPRRKRRRRLPRRRRIATRFNLGRALFVLPNLFTVSNIFCGFYAIVLICGEPGPEQFYRAGLAIFFGFFFDMADGRVARMTRTQSDFGVQLDSLSDMVTFGVAPALIVYRWGLSELGLWGIVVAFVYVACGALRLARSMSWPNARRRSASFSSVCPFRWPPEFSARWSCYIKGLFPNPPPAPCTFSCLCSFCPT